MTAKRDFVIMKGQACQIEHDVANKSKLTLNNEIGFKCLHYSVAESSGRVKIAVQNKLNHPQTVGVKTLEDSAVAGEDFEAIDVQLTIPPLSQKSVLVKIKDDEGWEPDEDFFVYLYDPNDTEKKQLYGDNTRTKVTILDDDKPGTF